MTYVRTEPVLSCEFCQVPGEIIHSNLIDRLCDVEGKFNIRQCKKCTLEWLDPCPIQEDSMLCYGYHKTDLTPLIDESDKRSFAGTRDTLREAILCGYYGYNKIHAQHKWCWLGKILGNFNFFRNKATYDLSGVFPFAPKNPEALLLDVGCGQGSFLELMKRLGWLVCGLEPHHGAVLTAQKKGIKVIEKGLMDSGLANQSVDFISMVHVIEHLYDPKKAIEECLRILKPGGILTMRTPNAASLGKKLFKNNWFAIDPPRHLNLFSPKSMSILFKDLSFSKVTITTSGDGAKSIFNNSMPLVRGERARLRDVAPSKGRRLFAFKENLLISLGFPVGEELRIMVVK